MLLYQETVLELGTKRLIAYCHEHGIGTILSGNLSDETARREIMESGLEIAASVNYTMYPEEFEAVCSANGFVYVQAWPPRKTEGGKRARDTEDYH